jgi:hypothetical protein
MQFFWYQKADKRGFASNFYLRTFRCRRSLFSLGTSEFRLDLLVVMDDLSFVSTFFTVLCLRVLLHSIGENLGRSRNVSVRIVSGPVQYGTLHLLNMSIVCYSFTNLLRSPCSAYSYKFLWQKMWNAIVNECPFIAKSPHVLPYLAFSLASCSHCYVLYNLSSHLDAVFCPRFVPCGRRCCDAPWWSSSLPFDPQISSCTRSYIYRKN